MFLWFRLFFGIVFNQANAQTTISLQAAIDTALKNNLTIKHEKLKSDYQRKIIKTSATICCWDLDGLLKFGLTS